MRTHYSTKQKEIVLKIIKENKDGLTVKEIEKLTLGNVGLTTIYRILDLLHENNIVKKVPGNTGSKYFYLEPCTKANHFYLKCNKCNKLIHIDCDCLEKLSSHILYKHNFNIDDRNFFISGLCHECEETK